MPTKYEYPSHITTSADKKAYRKWSRKNDQTPTTTIAQALAPKELTSRGPVDNHERWTALICLRCGNPLHYSEDLTVIQPIALTEHWTIHTTEIKPTDRVL